MLALSGSTYVYVCTCLSSLPLVFCSSLLLLSPAAISLCPPVCLPINYIDALDSQPPCCPVAVVVPLPLSVDNLPAPSPLPPPPHSPPPTHLFYRPPQHVVSLLRQLSRIKATWQISSLICLLLLFSVYSFVLFYLALFVFPLLFSVVLLSATHRLAPWHIVWARCETGLLPLTMRTMIVDSR